MFKFMFLHHNYINLNNLTLGTKFILIYCLTSKLKFNLSYVTLVYNI